MNKPESSPFKLILLVVVIVAALGAIAIFVARSQAPQQGSGSGEVKQMKASSRGRRSHS